MTNYYEELKLDKTLSLNELRENLIRLESIWTDFGKISFAWKAYGPTGPVPARRRLRKCWC